MSHGIGVFAYARGERSRIAVLRNPDPVELACRARNGRHQTNLCPRKTGLDERRCKMWKMLERTGNACIVLERTTGDAQALAAVVAITESAPAALRAHQCRKTSAQKAKFRGPARLLK